MTLPIYQATLDNLDDGIFSLSLVSEPATEFQMLCFNKQKFEYSVENAEEHIIKFPVMLCDTPIYRNYLNYEFYITYSREVLKSMAQRFLSESNQNNYDIEHNGVLLPKGSIEMIELFQKDIANGIDPKGFETVSDGSLLATCRVCDETLWEMCKSGDFSGISLTGFFSLVEQEFSKLEKKQNFNMTLNNLKNLIKDILLNYNNQESSIGNIFYSGEEIQVGTALTDKEGNPIADGLVKIDGYDLVVKNGMVESMTPTTVEEEETPSTEEAVETPITEEVKEDEPKEDETHEEETPIEEQPTEEETPVEETPTDVTPLVEEPQPNADIEGLKAEVDALKNAIAELLAKINQPVEKPVIEEFSAVSEKDKNLPKNIQKLMRYGSYLNKD